MNIKLYANEEIKAGWESKGLSKEKVKEELRRTMKVLAGLEKSGDPSEDPNGDPPKNYGLEIKLLNSQVADLKSALNTMKGDVKVLKEALDF